MIRYALDMDIKPLQPGIDYLDGLVLTGSCFSDHIAKRMQDCCFRVFYQPNGVVFNPVSLADPFIRLAGKGDYTDADLIQDAGLWHSKYHHGSFSETGKSDVLRKVNHSLHELRRSLQGGRWLFVTLGSAWVYEYLESGEIVANCHKISADRFRKRLLGVEEIVSVWKEVITSLHILNPELRCVFTVSPVRHLRDGVAENNLSKAVLLLAVRALQESFPEIAYFPAFELVNDDLRDYRFYENDGAHPNQMAIDHVYRRFCSACLNERTRVYAAELEAYLRMSRHRLLRADGEEYLHFMRKLEESREALNRKYDLEL